MTTKFRQQVVAALAATSVEDVAPMVLTQHEDLDFRAAARRKFRFKLKRGGLKSTIRAAIEQLYSCLEQPGADQASGVLPEHLAARAPVPAAGLGPQRRPPRFTRAGDVAKHFKRFRTLPECETHHQTAATLTGCLFVGPKIRSA